MPARSDALRRARRRSGRFEEPVDGRLHACRAPIQDVRVDHRGRDVFVAEELLDGAELASIFEQMGGERMPESVAGGPFADLRVSHRSADGPLHDGLVEMMTASLTRTWLTVGSRGGENPLPGPFAASHRQLSRQGVGQLDPACVLFEVALVLDTHPVEMGRQPRLQSARKNCGAVLRSLPVSDEDLMPLEIHVLHTKSTALEQPQSRSVEQRDHELGHPFEMSQHPADLVAGEKDWQSFANRGSNKIVEPGKIDTQELPVEEEDRCESLVLRRRRDAAFVGEHVQEGRHLIGTETSRVPPSMEVVIAPHPAEMGFLGPRAESPKPHRLPCPHRESGLVLWRSGIGHRRVTLHCPSPVAHRVARGPSPQSVVRSPQRRTRSPEPAARTEPKARRTLTCPHTHTLTCSHERLGVENGP